MDFKWTSQQFLNPGTMKGYFWIGTLYIFHLVRPGVQDPSTERCFCQLTGKVEECCCDVETVDQLNKEIHPLMTELVKNNYFKFFKVNLNRQCPFWPDDGRCALKDCSVSACKEEELPSGIKGGDEVNQRQRREAKGSSSHKDDELQTEAKDNKGETCGSKNETILGEVDSTISDEDKEAFEVWHRHDDAEENFCELDDDSSSDMEYVDLLRNPERFTGYEGFSAHRVWNSIYKENCFKVSTPYEKGYRALTYEDLGSLCLEKRVFFRALSGLHASINIHLCSKYLFRGNGLLKSTWGMNLQEFRRRFDPETTNGQGPSWLKNLYFSYTLVLRAISKMSSYWEQEQFYTGDFENDETVQKLVKELLKKFRSCPSTFDEKLMFRDPATAKVLKGEFKSHFRNISRIMDCVGCDKCRLWGKLQVQGIGTALKILFSGRDFDSDVPTDFHLKRTEIVSLFNAFAKLSESINNLQKFKAMDHDHR